MIVMAGLVPAISLRDALTQCPPKRDHRVKPGDDSSLLELFAGLHLAEAGGP